MVNFEDTYVILKELSKIVNNFQGFVSPNIQNDINNLKIGIEGVKHNIALAKHNLDKTSRFIKLRKHKSNRKKKKFNKLS